MNSPQQKTLTLSTCFYVLPQAKFEPAVYVEWLANFLAIMRYNPHLYLVIYTDEHSATFLPPLARELPAVAVALKRMEDFHMYKYADKFRANHEHNYLLRMSTSWELNMLWCQKLWFVQETIQRGVFPATPWYAWCDAGYFRNRLGGEDLHTGRAGEAYMSWASPSRMADLDATQIYYALVNPNLGYLRTLKRMILDRDPRTDLPRFGIPQSQVSIGGGFCLLAAAMIDDWCGQFEGRLAAYFAAGTTVKDDQIVLADCIFYEADARRFFLVSERGPVRYDPWFVFQRFLN